MATALVLPSAPAPPAARGEERPLVPEPHRRLYPRPPRTRGPRSVPGGRPHHADPAGDAGPDRAAAHPRRGGRLPGGSEPRRLREGGGPPAGLAALRRAHGGALARRRP